MNCDVSMVANIAPVTRLKVMPFNIGNEFVPMSIGLWLYLCGFGDVTSALTLTDTLYYNMIQAMLPLWWQGANRLANGKTMTT